MQFPIGMGTGAVYVTLSGVKNHTPALTWVEAIFYCINVGLFLMNTSALLLQALRESQSVHPLLRRSLDCYYRQYIQGRHGGF